MLAVSLEVENYFSTVIKSSKFGGVYFGQQLYLLSAILHFFNDEMSADMNSEKNACNLDGNGASLLNVYVLFVTSVRKRKFSIYFSNAVLVFPVGIFADRMGNRGTFFVQSIMSREQ